MKQCSSLVAMAMLGLLIPTGCGMGHNNVTTVESANAVVAPNNPEPSNIIERIDPKNARGNHHFDHADSIWCDGSWSEHKTGLFGPRFVISFMGTGENGVITHPNQPLIVVYNEDESPYVPGVEWVDYPCPRNIGHIIITGITNDGTVVHFNSSQGIHGTLDLNTHQWNFSRP